MVEMAALDLLSTHGLTRQYGGLLAVNNVNFNLNPDRIHAIIGPNGAGKTTLVSLICGRTTPTSGRITFKGKDITAISSAKRVQAGIVYTFQVTIKKATPLVRSANRPNNSEINSVNAAPKSKPPKADSSR